MKDLYKLLIIDDRPENLFALDAVLKSRGYMVDTALSGDKGLELLNENKYGLVILDVQMPVMNGFEVAKVIKQNDHSKNIPIIFLSANSPDKFFFQKGYEAGALDYLTKPIDEDLLLLKVDNFLKLHHQQILLERHNRILEKRAIRAEISYKDLYFSLAPDIFLINTDEIIVDINKKDILSCGIPVKSCLNQSIDSVSFLREIWNDNQTNGTPFQFADFFEGARKVEFHFEKPDGSSFYGEAIISGAILSALPHIQICVNDITESYINKLKLDKEIKSSKRYHAISLSSQMNPHFMFNALNSIQYFILSGDNSEAALNFVAEFSNLMRISLTNSRSEFIRISDEILFLECYLKLEQKRLNNLFNYTISYPQNQNPDDLYIPPMLIQPYIENAIVHGISKEIKHPEINLSFSVRSNKLECRIKDNGVGRKKAQTLRNLRKQKKTHESFAMNITETKLNLLNDLYGDLFSVKITDLMDKKNQPCGTEIKLMLPRYYADDLFDLEDV